jgi:SAM-dependent methyltransferase
MPDHRRGIVARVVRRVRGWSDRARQRARAAAPVASVRGPLTCPDGLPLPPARLMNLVAGSSDAGWFLDGGRLGASSMQAILLQNGVILESLGAILDFGCGSGRVMRQWRSLKGPALFGTDYNPELVAWCAANLPFATFRVNRLHGGVDFPDAAFDLVYAFSVFTHLDLAAQSFWIAELARVLKRGGFLFLTTHGEYYLSRLSPRDQEAFRSGRLVVSGARRAGSNDCAVFHPVSYVRQALASAGGLDVVAFVPEGALGNPRQDVYLLRKPL